MTGAHDGSALAVTTDEADGISRRDLFKEGYTMALYVTICLLAALTAVSEDVRAGHTQVLTLMWGTTVGLALAHWFAFRMSAQLVTGGSFDAHDVRLSLAQLAGAAAVAALVTVPVLLLPASAELDAARILLGLVLGGVGWEVARRNGASTWRAAVYAGLTLAAGLAVALVKNVVSGH